jgi:hypothetical protein
MSAHDNEAGPQMYPYGLEQSYRIFLPVLSRQCAVANNIIVGPSGFRGAHATLDARSQYLWSAECSACRCRKLDPSPSAT